MNKITNKKLVDLVFKKEDEIENFFKNWICCIVPDTLPWLVDKFIYKCEIEKRNPHEHQNHEGPYMENAILIYKELRRLSNNIQLEDEYHRKSLKFLLIGIGRLLMDTVFLAHNFKNFIEKETQDGKN